MKVLRYFFQKTLTYKIWKVFSSGYRYILVNDTVGKFIHSKEFGDILKQYLHVDFDEDWIGRLYSVINPYINIDDRLDTSSVIVELDGERTNTQIQVENWISKQLALIYQLFKLQKIDIYNLFQEITIDFKHVGPKNHDNYLIVLDLVQRQEFAKNVKRMLIHAGIYSIMLLLIYFAM